MDPHHHHHPPWSDLSADILEHIVSLLSTFADQARFGSVCRSWRQTTSPTSRHGRSLRSPWLILSRSGTAWSLFSPVEARARRVDLPSTSGCECAGSSLGWLLMAHPWDGIHLVNPLTGRQLHLPRDTTVSRNCNFRYAVLSARPDGGGGGCVVVAVCRGEPTGLVYSKPGNAKWSVFAKRCNAERSAVDIIFFDGLLYVVTLTHEILVFEFCPKPVIKHEYSPVGIHVNNPRKFLYLVESAGELLMVIKPWVDEARGEEPSPVGVYRLDRGSSGSWEMVTSFGNEVLFLSKGCSLSVDVGRIPGFGCRPNCIYFFERWNRSWAIREFCMEDAKSRPFIPVGLPSIKFGVLRWVVLSS